MDKEHESFPSYTPMPSLGHELGVMFGFMGFCIVSVAVYWFIWQAVQRRASNREAARREALSARGINEKGIDQHGNQVHGMREGDLGYSQERNQDGLGIGGAGVGMGMGGQGRFGAGEASFRG